MFALAALVAFVIGAVLDWQHTDHATLFLYVGLALLAAHLLAPVTPWKR
jgi:hypothetical protein